MEDQPTGDLDRTVPTLDDDAIREFDASAVAPACSPSTGATASAGG